MEKNAKILVAGHRGLLGSAIVRQLKAQGFDNLLLRTRKEVDLTERAAVLSFMQRERPQFVFLAAAKVGGIHANNTYPADFIFQNLLIELSVIDGAYQAGVERLIFLGSSCIYPRDCPQPIAEEHLLTGKLEETNRPYAIAKIGGIELCWAYNRQYDTKYLAAMPTNLYGIGDRYEQQMSHVIPALIAKFHEAKVQGLREVKVWGTGRPRREFLYSDDAANACVFLMNLPDGQFNSLLPDGAPPLINIGVGSDITIAELAQQIADVVELKAKIVFDPTMPDGTPQKLLNVSKLQALGWRPRVELHEGLKNAYRDFCDLALPSSVPSVPTGTD